MAISFDLPVGLDENQIRRLLDRPNFRALKRQPGDRLRWLATLGQQELEIYVRGDTLFLPDGTPRPIQDRVQSRIVAWNAAGGRPVTEREAFAKEIYDFVIGVDDTPYTSLTNEQLKAILGLILFEMKAIKFAGPDKGKINLIDRDESGQIIIGGSRFKRLSTLMKRWEEKQG